MNSGSHIPRTAAFVRGFFMRLEAAGAANAVLHGGGDGFERPLSDVDFVVDGPTFDQLPNLIDSHCKDSAWRLCQILRHETTAAYFVCSAADDPACVVALDACSDYQRYGTVFLTADELLENRWAFAWGGHRVSELNHLRYRFAKAAAKDKDPDEAAGEFSEFPEEVRIACGEWLEKHWQIRIRGWDAPSVAAALAQLGAKSNPRPALHQSGAIGRMISRILQPTGLVVIVRHPDFDATAALLENTFSRLYFRRFRKAARWSPRMIKDLVASTLIVVPELGAFWRRVLPVDCLYQVFAGDECQAIAEHLHLRCKRRETR